MKIIKFQLTSKLKEEEDLITLREALKNLTEITKKKKK